MRTIILFVSFSAFINAYAQKGDELLVYSLKGNVTVIENNAESKVRIGKVLKPGSTVKTQKQAMLTLVCKQGKPISVTREGSFPVAGWKDSCETSHQSMTTRYFQFIWDQLYVRSDEYKKDHPHSEGLTDAPVRGNEELEVFVNPFFDTIYYASGSFPLSWSTTKPYSGKYFFTLKNIKTNKVVYSDSFLAGNIPLDKLKKYMRVNNSYRWILSINPVKEGEGGIIKYVSTTAVTRQVNKIRRMVNVPEDLAAQNFRIAYMLQEIKYLPDALIYFQKASQQAPDLILYNDRLLGFKKEFQLDQ